MEYDSEQPANLEIVERFVEEYQPLYYSLQRQPTVLSQLSLQPQQPSQRHGCTQVHMVHHLQGTQVSVLDYNQGAAQA